MKRLRNLLYEKRVLRQEWEDDDMSALANDPAALDKAHNDFKKKMIKLNQRISRHMKKAKLHPGHVKKIRSALNNESAERELYAGMSELDPNDAASIARLGKIDNRRMNRRQSLDPSPSPPRDPDPPPRPWGVADMHPAARTGRRCRRCHLPSCTSVHCHRGGVLSPR